MLLVVQFLACAVVKVGPMCNQCEKLRIENERLKSKLSIADLKTHKEKTLRILALLNECDTLKAENDGVFKTLAQVLKERDTLKAKLAEVEAERERLEDLLGAIHDTTLEADTKSRIANNLDATPNGWRFRKSQLTREREAAKVMREALEQIQSLAANEHEQGDSKALDDVLDLTCETFKALAKADEIRGKNE